MLKQVDPDAKVERNKAAYEKRKLDLDAKVKAAERNKEAYETRMLAQQAKAAEQAQVLDLEIIYKYDISFTFYYHPVFCLATVSLKNKSRRSSLRRAI